MVKLSTMRGDNLKGKRAWNYRHGGQPKYLYEIWKAMRRRCSCPTTRGYSDYGGRGIRVCERWDSYETFRQDMGERPSPEHSIERKNNDGNYEPGNCRWATEIEQRHNQRLRRFPPVRDPITGQYVSCELAKCLRAAYELSAAEQDELIRRLQTLRRDGDKAFVTIREHSLIAKS
jgi:hypothetical protein